MPLESWRVERVVDHPALTRARFGLRIFWRHCREALLFLPEMGPQALRLARPIQQAVVVAVVAVIIRVPDLLAALVGFPLAAVEAAALLRLREAVA
jgi:hypothetical protein